MQNSPKPPGVPPAPRAVRFHSSAIGEGPTATDVTTHVAPLRSPGRHVGGSMKASISSALRVGLAVMHRAERPRSHRRRQPSPRRESLLPQPTCRGKGNDRGLAGSLRFRPSARAALLDDAFMALFGKTLFFDFGRRTGGHPTFGDVQSVL